MATGPFGGISARLTVAIFLFGTGDFIPYFRSLWRQFLNVFIYISILSFIFET